MKAFMTNGTIEFLQKLEAKYPTITFFFMNSSTGGLAYYEGNGKNVFSAGRAYEVLIKNGDIKEKGYVVMNNIPVTDEGKPIFEDAFKQQQSGVESMPGFQAFRLLKPMNGNTYVVFTQWESELYFDNWKNSEQFKKAHKDQATKPPAYFADRPFITSYHMMEKED